MTLDESCLSDTSISNQNELEFWDRDLFRLKRERKQHTVSNVRSKSYFEFRSKRSRNPKTNAS
jgi:hypothetical protein